MINVSNENDVKYSKNKSKRLEDQHFNDICLVLSTREGRRIVWQIIQDSGVEQHIFYGNSRDIYESGKKCIGASLKWLVLNAIGYAAMEQMFQEWKEDLKNEELLDEKHNESKVRR